MRVGILAYGSLLECPGTELKERISRRIESVETPFRIEFARRSRNRDCAPTVVPVECCGCCVYGAILVLEHGITVTEAKDLLWRRETGKEGSGKQYRAQANPETDTVVIKELYNFQGIDVVLYAQIGANIPIEDRTPGRLAEFAIESAKGSAGADGKDGISYLMSLKRVGVLTSLMSAYEEEILGRTGTSCLEDAWRKVREGI